MSLDISIYLGIASLSVSFITLLTTQWRYSLINSKELEKRLSTVESHTMTPEERKCLNDIKIKTDLLWSIIEDELPKILKRDDTPLFDFYLDKLMTKKDFNNKELKEFLDLTDNEIKTAIESKDRVRFTTLSLLKARIMYSLIEKGEVCK